MDPTGIRTLIMLATLGFLLAALVLFVLSSRWKHRHRGAGSGSSVPPSTNSGTGCTGSLRPN
ncbi:hypothetical protein [Nocardiopsis salina]|uniref:hypothetical protein n=1 Tax=Nocardiopsis salina TaxID=245836 RepID=UPI0003483979|nr:hypothetical protein [Nocardiopsis salina]